MTGNNAEGAEMGLRRAQKWRGEFVAGWQKTQNGLFCAAGGVGVCLIRLVMGAEKGPRGVCSGAFGLFLFGLILGVLLSALLAVALYGVAVGFGLGYVLGDDGRGVHGPAVITVLMFKIAVRVSVGSGD